MRIRDLKLDRVEAWPPAWRAVPGRKGTVARLAVIVLVARLLLDLGTPLCPGAFGLERLGIEGAGARHQRSGIAVIAVALDGPRPIPNAVAALAEGPRAMATAIPPPRPSTHRPLRLLPSSTARPPADDPGAR